jgi:hypothetical protein
MKTLKYNFQILFNMTINNHEKDILNRLKINLFTPCRLGGSKFNLA